MVTRVLREAGFILEFILLVVLGALLFAVVAVAIRPFIVLLLAVGALVGGALCCFSPTFRHWFESAR